MLIYGKNPVREALRGPRKVERVWVERQLEGPEWGSAVEIADSEQLTELCRSAEHQGVVAEVGPFPYVGLDELFAGGEPLVVALDEIQDPHNLGAVARVAEGAGASGLILHEHRSAQVTPAVCKASAGAVEHLRIARVTNLSRALEQAKKGGAWVYGATSDSPEAVAYTEPDYSGSVVLVLGSEGSGLRPGVAKACDALVKIALDGKVESLNVSTAAAVMLFAIRQKRLDINKS